jgi:hypothetical protein
MTLNVATSVLVELQDGVLTVRGALPRLVLTQDDAR